MKEADPFEDVDDVAVPEKHISIRGYSRPAISNAPTDREPQPKPKFASLLDEPEIRHEHMKWVYADIAVIWERAGLSLMRNEKFQPTITIPLSWYRAPNLRLNDEPNHTAIKVLGELVTDALLKDMEADEINQHLSILCSPENSDFGDCESLGRTLMRDLRSIEEGTTLDICTLAARLQVTERTIDQAVIFLIERGFVQIGHPGWRSFLEGHDVENLLPIPLTLAEITLQNQLDSDLFHLLARHQFARDRQEMLALRNARQGFVSTKTPTQLPDKPWRMASSDAEPLDLDPFL